MIQNGPKKNYRSNKVSNESENRSIAVGISSEDKALRDQIANLDDKEGECITDFDDLHDHAIQSIRFKPTEEEIQSVLDEVQILVGEISQKFLTLDHRSIPINVH